MNTQRESCPGDIIRVRHQDHDSQVDYLCLPLIVGLETAMVMDGS